MSPNHAENRTITTIMRQDRVRSVIVAAARTPVGKFGGALGHVPAVALGAAAIAAALDRAAASSASLDRRALAAQVDYVIMGHVLQAGTGQITARQAAVAAGLPAEVPAISVNKVCLASLSAIALADQLIRAGEIEIAVAGGMESMSLAPFVVSGMRWGRRIGNERLVDTLVHDGLWSSFTGQSMGESSDQLNTTFGISRREQDTWAARSHRRAALAWASGRFAEEVIPVEIEPGRTLIDRDEGIRPDTEEAALAKLAPAFSTDGTITAGNASQLSDGGAAVVVMKAERAQALGIPPLAEILAHGMCAQQFAHLHTVPAIALQRAAKKAGVHPSDLGLVEINEAFASVAIHSTRLLSIDEQIVNVNGGSIALGHALGSTGARMAVTLLHEMTRRAVPLGGVTLCGGGGQGDALVLRLVDG
jgi:acetyl-CoA C-acetyltransferase